MRGAASPGWGTPNFLRKQASQTNGGCDGGD